MVKIKIYSTIIFCCLAMSVSAQTVYVSTASQLQTALNNAVAGQIIQIADGYYERSGGFYAVAGINGTAANPITVTGSRNVVLSTNNLTSGYSFSLKGNNYWIIKGFTVTNSKNGIVLDSSKYVTIDSIAAKKIGQEGIHLRTYTSYCTVKNCYIDSTGLNDYSYGEGIYIGSAYSNWCTYTNCNPDTCNYNQVLNNNFGNFITAENVDIKEGTKNGIIKGNNFNGTGLQGLNGGDSWIDVKGNYYSIENNTGVGSILDGYQTHIPQTGYGNYNTFKSNTLTVNSTGYGIRIQTSNSNGTALNNIVCDNNIVTAAASGLTNISTTTCAAVLPVLLINWNADEKSGVTFFNWEVSPGNSIQEFIIESSVDGKNFSAIKVIDAGGTKYHQAVESFLIGNKKYFRLLTLLKNNGSFYSDIIQISSQKNRYGIHITNKQLIVESDNNAAIIKVCNGLGQVLYTSMLKQGSNTIDCNKARGFFVIIIYSEGNVVYQKKFLN